MGCAFFILQVAALLAPAGLGALVWFGGRRVAAHLERNPEAARLLAEHVITPLLVGDKVAGKDWGERGQGRGGVVMDRMLSVAQAAERLSVSPALVYGWCNAGVITHHRLGLPGRRGCIRIAEADLDAFIAGRKREGRQEVPGRPLPSAYPPETSSSAFLSVSFRCSVARFMWLYVSATMRPVECPINSATAR